MKRHHYELVQRGRGSSPAFASLLDTKNASRGHGLHCFPHLIVLFGGILIRCIGQNTRIFWISRAGRLKFMYTQLGCMVTVQHSEYKVM